MKLWQANWEFKKLAHRRDGERGKDNVRAETKEEAENGIKLQASQKLFGTTMMQTYIEVYNIIQLDD